MSGVLVFGDITVDLLVELPADPVFGADNLTPSISVQCGGVGANAAVALARWGVPVRLLGCVGRDVFGDFALHFVASQGVDVSLVQRNADSATGVFFIGVSPGGQRTIFGSRGANAACDAPSATCLDGMAAVLLQGYNFLSPSATAAAEQLLAEARKRGVRVAFDAGAAPCQQIPQSVLQAAAKADILFVGLSEARALTGEPDTYGVHGALVRHLRVAASTPAGPKEIVLKLGEQGCSLFDGGWHAVPALKVPVIDTTGAGDAFAAAYLRARLHNWTPKEAALLANAAGAAAAMELGTGDAMPRPAAVMGLLGAVRFSSDWEAVRTRLLEKLHVELRAAGASSGGTHGTAA